MNAIRNTKMNITKNVLVHVCCAPCASYSLKKLINDGYKVTAYFYNPNIHPEEEYNKRLAELERFAGEMDYSLVVEVGANPCVCPGNEDRHTGQDRHMGLSLQQWFAAVKGFENEPEGGKRCEICFKMRLEKTALYAKEHGFDAFTTVLTISPHKNSRIIHAIGRGIGEKHGIPFLEEDFKKQDGFKKSLELSQKYGFYRQNYCGCVYSFR